jgi:hypothetical protein
MKRIGAIAALVFGAHLSAQTNPGFPQRIASLDVADTTALGSNLVTDPNFNDATKWSAVLMPVGGGSASYSGIGSHPPPGNVRQTLSLLNGALYQFSLTVASAQNVTVSAQVCGSNPCGTQFTVMKAGTYTLYVAPTGTGFHVTIQCSVNTIFSAQGGSCSIAAVSVRQVIGGNLFARGKFTGGGTDGLQIDPQGNATLDHNLNINGLAGCGAGQKAPLYIDERKQVVQGACAP